MRIFFGLTLLIFFQTIGFSQPGSVNFEEKLIESKKWSLLGNYEKALEGFLSLAKDSRDNALLCYEIARIYDILGQSQQALDWARKGKQNEPQNIWYSTFLIDLLDKNNLFDEAISINQELIELFPNDQLYWDKKLYFQLKANKKTDALLTTENLIKKFGNHLKILDVRIQLLIEFGQIKKAEQELLTLIQAQPNNLTFYHFFADFYLKTSQKTKADEVFKKILTLFPEDTKAKLALLNQGNQGLFEKYEPIFMDSRISLDEKIKLILPVIQKITENPDFAAANSLKQLCNILLENYPPSAKLYALAGDIEQTQNLNKEAIRWYQKSIELDPSIFPVWEMLWFLQLKEGDFESLQNSAEEGLNLFPFNQKIYYLLSLAAYKKGKLEESINLIDEGILYNAEEIPFNLLKTLIYIEKSNISEAFDLINSLGINHPENSEIKAYLAYIKTLQGKSEEALIIINTLLKQNQLPFPVYFLASKIYMLSKDFLNAELLANEYLKSGHLEFLGETFEIIGNIREIQGNIEEAVYNWKIAVGKGISNDLIKEKLNRYDPK